MDKVYFEKSNEEYMKVLRTYVDLGNAIREDLGEDIVEEKREHATTKLMEDLFVTREEFNLFACNNDMLHRVDEYIYSDSKQHHDEVRMEPVTYLRKDSSLDY